MQARYLISVLQRAHGLPAVAIAIVGRAGARAVQKEGVLAERADRDGQRGRGAGRARELHAVELVDDHRVEPGKIWGGRGKRGGEKAKRRI